MDDIDRIKTFLKNIDENNIITTSHYAYRSWMRPVSEERVKNILRKVDDLVFCEKKKAKKETEEKYKLWFRVSGRYCLVVLVVFSEKDLYIVSAWTGKIK